MPVVRTVEQGEVCFGECALISGDIAHDQTHASQSPNPLLMFPRWLQDIFVSRSLGRESINRVVSEVTEAQLPILEFENKELRTASSLGLPHTQG